MSFSLYEAVVPTLVQILHAGQAWLEKAVASGVSEEELAAARLADDMLPFAYQVKSMVVHSVGAIEGVRRGMFTPDMGGYAMSLEQMRLDLGAAENTLRAMSKGEIDSFVGGETRFVMEKAGIDLPFASEDFLLSFSQPNFYFHASTAYGILRHLGIEVGKRDFLGPMRFRHG